MPRFHVVVAETVYLRGEVTADTLEEAKEIPFEDMELVEYDSSEELVECEEIS